MIQISSLSRNFLEYSVKTRKCINFQALVTTNHLLIDFEYIIYDDGTPNLICAAKKYFSSITYILYVLAYTHTIILIYCYHLLTCKNTLISKSERWIHVYDEISSIETTTSQRCLHLPTLPD